MLMRGSVISPQYKAEPYDSLIEFWCRQNGAVLLSSDVIRTGQFYWTCFKFMEKVDTSINWLDPNVELLAFKHKEKTTCP